MELRAAKRADGGKAGDIAKQKAADHAICLRFHKWDRLRHLQGVVYNGKLLLSVTI
jgi:hypothetical protein